MVRKLGIVAAVLVVGAFAASPASATFTVDIRADIPSIIPIVGWGIDVWFDEGMVGAVDSVTFGADWYELAAQSPDPDDPLVDLNLQGLTTWPEPTPGVTGNVLLATIVFTGAGDAASLMVGDHNPWNGLGDLNEGFAVEPPPSGNFGEVIGDGLFYDDMTPGDTGVFTIGFVPEPATLSLLILGGLALLRRR